MQETKTKLSAVMEEFNELDMIFESGRNLDVVETGLAGKLINAVSGKDKVLECEALKSLGDLYLRKAKTKEHKVENFNKACVLYQNALQQCKSQEEKQVLHHRIKYAEKCTKLVHDQEAMKPGINVLTNITLTVSLTLQEVEEKTMVEGQGAMSLIESYANTFVEAIKDRNKRLELESLKCLGDLYLDKGRVDKSNATLTKATGLYRAALDRCEDSDGRETLEHRIKYSEKVKEKTLKKQKGTGLLRKAADGNIPTSPSTSRQAAHNVTSSRGYYKANLQDNYWALQTGDLGSPATLKSANVKGNAEVLKDTNGDKTDRSLRFSQNKRSTASNMMAGPNLQPQIFSGRLTLNLSNKGLTSIPEEVFDITDLEHLDVSNNKLTSIPEAIGRLRNLCRLVAAHNMLKTLPHAVCSLPRLCELAVSYNKLSFLPQGIGNMQTLEYLHLDQNELKEIPSEVCRLPILRMLGVCNNKLSSLPLDVEMMQSLQMLVISGNELTEVPPGVCSLSNLDEVLDLARNKISILPTGVEKLQKLKTLYLDDNELTELPVEVCLMPKLERLSVRKNSISVLPACTDVKYMQKLTYLALTDNKLKELPLEVCSLRNLESLLVGCNPIRRLPNEITHLTRLKVLELANCLLDEFPRQVLQLRVLEELIAGKNHLSVIPDEVGNLENLQILALDINLLRALPSTISNLKKLCTVHIFSNKFEKFPEALGNLPALEKVDVHNNQITRLPISLHRADKLKELDVSGNPLTYPPQNICQQGTSAIMTFLKQEAEKDEKLRKAFLRLTDMVVDKQEQIRMARYLDVSDEDVKSIQEESPDDVMYQVLQKWREKWRDKEGPETTLSRLTGLLSDMDLRQAASSISQNKKPRMDNWADLKDHTEQGKLSINLPIIDELQLDGLEFIDRGAFAEVMKAHHKDWDVDVAVKRLTQQVNGVEEKDLLYSEVKKMIIASTSPHIVDIRGICSGLDFSIVMTFMENGSLKRLLREEDICVPWALRWRIAHEISLGLNFLHCLDPQIIHCDVKAANVLLDNEFHAKIGDFGLAKWRTKSRLVKSTSPEGVTPTHAAPEHFQGREPDAKFDVYSFGITLWEILTRKEPYEYIKPEFLATIVRGGDRPAKAFLPDDTEGMGGMVTLMNDCWNVDPLNRPNMKDCCSSLAKGCAIYTDYDMLDAVITIKRGKDKKRGLQGAHAEPERQWSEDLR